MAAARREYRSVLVSEVLMGAQLVDHGQEDQARWWHAYQLAENNQADELRRLAAAGDDHARRQLASWLAWSGQLEELHEQAQSGDDYARHWLAAALRRRYEPHGR